MFYSIEVSSVNTALINDIVCGEFASLASLRSDAWYKPSVMKEHVSSWNNDNPNYKISCGSSSDGYSAETEFADCWIISPNGRLMSFVLDDDGSHYAGGAVGTFTIDFPQGSSNLALRLLSNLEYYNLLDQVENISTTLPFTKEDG